MTTTIVRVESLELEDIQEAIDDNETEGVSVISVTPVVTHGTSFTLIVLQDS